jgi:hypothetical protein
MLAANFASAGVEHHIPDVATYPMSLSVRSVYVSQIAMAARTRSWASAPPAPVEVIRPASMT